MGRRRWIAIHYIDTVKVYSIGMLFAHVSSALFCCSMFMFNTSAQRFKKMVGMAAMLEVKKFTPFAFRRVRSAVRVLLLLLCSVSTE